MNSAKQLRNSTALAACAVVVIAALACFQVGCASVTAVAETTAASETMLRAPETIYIAPFETSSGMWQGRANDPRERIRIRDWLMAELETELAGIAPTGLLPEGDNPTSGWLVTGRFVRVNPGSKFQRMFIGLGAGGSKLETKVSIYDLAVSRSQPILTINTTGGSNLQAGPAALVNNATSSDINRTAREIQEFVQGRLWQTAAKVAPSPTGDRPPIAIENGPRSH